MVDPKTGEDDLSKREALRATVNLREKDVENEARKLAAQISPETQKDVEAERGNYEASIKSLEIDLSALDTLFDGVRSDGDSLQASLFNAKVADVAEQIKSLDAIYKNEGYKELDERLAQVKIKFAEFEAVDTEKLRANM